MWSQWNRIQYKQTGKAAFLSNYWPFVGVSVLLFLLLNSGAYLSDFSNLSSSLSVLSTSGDVSAITQLGAAVMPFAVSLGTLSFLVRLLAGLPFEVGANRFFLESSPTRGAGFSRVGFGFTANYGNVLLTQFLRTLFNILWSLLFIIPGIIRSFGYFAIPFILAENPHMKSTQVIRLSLEMTRGYKWDIFVTELSFLGWFILDALTLGILGIFYVNPYYFATKAEMYRFLREQALARGLATREDLPGVLPQSL